MSVRDAIVRVVGDVGCTGTLIADDLVLTARACVAVRDGAGLPLPRLQSPERLRVELGGDYFPWAEAEVRAVVAPELGDAADDGGVAVLVLVTHLVDVPVIGLSVDAAPEHHEPLAVFGFGRCPDWPGAIHRRICDVGPIDQVTAASFVAPAALCPGDLGGPAFGPNRDLVGVLTSGALDGDGRVRAAARFARVDAWRAILAEAATAPAPSTR
jgi:hypothetical protein